MKSTGKTDVNEVEQKVNERGEQCMSKTCSTGVCSPCVFIWGIFALYLIGSFIMKGF